MTAPTTPNGRRIHAATLDRIVAILPRHDEPGIPLREAFKRFDQGASTSLNTMLNDLGKAGRVIVEGQAGSRTYRRAAVDSEPAPG